MDKDPDFITNELSTRLKVLNEVFGYSRINGSSFSNERRNIDNECGYLSTSSLTVEELKTMYDREPIASRVVQVLPEESWRTVPTVKENEDETVQTEFEKAWNNLSLTSATESKFKRKERSPIWEYLKRADMLSGIGYFGVLFLGINDGESNLLKPAEPKENQQLLFLRAFDQSYVSISAYDQDPNSPRYMQPLHYDITFSTPNSIGGGIGASEVVRKVHWTRCIHLADNIESNEVFGIPRMRAVWNRIYDLRKLYSGSAEMYWKGAFPGIALESHPSLGGEVGISPKELKDMMEDYQFGLQRYLALVGMSAKSLAPQVANPNAHIEAQIDAICIQLGIPKRIFIGSERGELASSQDVVTWNERLQMRQNSYLTPRVVAPFIDRLIYLKILPEPTEYSIEWPNLESQSPEIKANVVVKQMEAMSKYLAGDVDMILSPIDLYTKFFGLSPEIAEQILITASENFEGKEEQIPNEMEIS